MAGKARAGVCKREGESLVEEERVWIEEREGEGGGGCRERESIYLYVWYGNSLFDTIYKFTHKNILCN